MSISRNKYRAWDFSLLNCFKNTDELDLKGTCRRTWGIFCQLPSRKELKNLFQWSLIPSHRTCSRHNMELVRLPTLQVTPSPTPWKLVITFALPLFSSKHFLFINVDTITVIILPQIFVLNTLCILLGKPAGCFTTYRSYVKSSGFQLQLLSFSA